MIKFRGGETKVRKKKNIIKYLTSLKRKHKIKKNKLNKWHVTQL